MAPAEVAVASDREQDREMLARAATLRAPLARAARLAATNGMGYLVFGVLTALLSLSTSVSDLVALAVGAALIFVGLSSRTLSRRLRDGDAAAARTLARNELVLLVAIVAYCVLMLTVISPVSPEFDRELRNAGLPIDTEGLRSLGQLTYSIFLVVTLLYQGGLARYYRKRAVLAEAYVAEIPEWARAAVASLPT